MYTTLYDEPAVVGIADRCEHLIRKHGPLYMKVGGCGFSEGADRLTAEQREAMRARWRVFAGTCPDRELLERIAEVFGVHYSCVCRVTRDLRAEAKARANAER